MATAVAVAVGVGVDVGEGETLSTELGEDVVVELVATAGFTKVFDGASGGGVASDFIFVRAFSAAC